jgi:hypothetical protein
LGNQASLTVEPFLLPLGGVALRVFPAACVGLLPAVVGSASEGATQVLTPAVAWMREETNTTVATSHRAVLQARTISQQGIERELVFPNERTSAIMLVPIFSKRENFRNSYHQIAKFSVKTLIVFCIPSSYNLVA